MSLAVWAVYVPGSVSRNFNSNPFELVIPTTSVTILYPTLIFPGGLSLLFTFLS